MGNKETFAIRLKEVRLQTGKNQKEFADMVQSTAATISAYENATKNPSLEIVMNIAKKCNISIDWLCGLSEEQAIKPKIENYKDIAVKVLELLELDMSPYWFYWKKEKDKDRFIQTLVLPERPEFFNFMETYGDLCALLNNGRIKQHVMDTWLNGALEELKDVPINAPTEEFDEKHSNILDEPPQRNPLMSILKPAEPPQE